MDPALRSQTLHDLGVHHEDIVVDLFASCHNHTCPVYIDQQQDAFTFKWDELVTAWNHVLWANPPFSLIDKVVTKMIMEPCRFVLVCPVWKDATWWKVLD